MFAKNDRLNVDTLILNSRLPGSKFISNESFSLDWKQMAKSTPLLHDMTALNSSYTSQKFHAAWKCSKVPSSCVGSHWIEMNCIKCPFGI